MKKIEILYRTTRYGKWSPASINVPTDEKNILQYCIDDLKKMGLKPTHVTIQKTNR